MLPPMPRSPRIDYAGAWHHIMNRGAGRRDIFGDDVDRQVFIDLVADVMPRSGLEVHAYALMPNHYHLLLRSTDGRLSQAMQALGARYTRWFNLRNERDGAVFRGRFHNRLVVDDDHLVWLVPYLHLNPVRGSLSSTASACSWTSHRAYLGMSPAPRWLTTQFLLGLMGGRSSLAERVAGLESGRLEVPFGLHSETERTEAPNPPIARPAAPEHPLLDPETVLNRVCLLAGVPRDHLHVAQRGPRGNPARRFAAWALATSTRESTGQIARLLRMSPNQAVNILASFRLGRISEPIRGWMRAWSEEPSSTTEAGRANCVFQ